VHCFDRSWFNICGVSSSNGQNACTSDVGSSFLLHAIMPWAQQSGQLQCQCTKYIHAHQQHTHTHTHTHTHYYL